MRFFEIAMFLFIFNIISFTLTSSGLFSEIGLTAQVSFHDVDITESERADMENQFTESVGSSEITNQDPISVALGWVSQNILNSMSSVLNPLKDFVFVLPYMLTVIFQLPDGLAMTIGSIYWLIMIIGFVEFATGRNVEKRS